MNIDDILEKEEFQALDKFLTDEMYKYTTPEIRGAMDDLFINEKCARGWFYSTVPIFTEQRPYDLCRDGRSDEVLFALVMANYGSFG